MAEDTNSHIRQTSRESLRRSTVAMIVIEAQILAEALGNQRVQSR